MCNDYRLEVDIASIAEDFDDLQIKIKMPEGVPNVPAREDVRITDTAPIVKASDGSAIGELVNRRWSWPGQGGKPVYNVRSEGRDLGSQRCLVLCDGFYEFTDPANKAQKRLDKWLFTMKDHRWFCMAGIWRDSFVGEAFIVVPDGAALEWLGVIGALTAATAAWRRLGSRLRSVHRASLRSLPRRPQARPPGVALRSLRGGAAAPGRAASLHRRRRMSAPAAVSPPAARPASRLFVPLSGSDR